MDCLYVCYWKTLQSYTPGLVVSNYACQRKHVLVDCRQHFPCVLRVFCATQFSPSRSFSQSISQSLKPFSDTRPFTYAMRHNVWTPTDVLLSLPSTVASIVSVTTATRLQCDSTAVRFVCDSNSTHAIRVGPVRDPRLYEWTRSVSWLDVVKAD